MKARLAALALALGLAGCAAEPAPQFNWDSLGAAFCARAVAGDLDGLRGQLTPDLARRLDAGRATVGSGIMLGDQPFTPRLFVQSFNNAAPGCTPRTRNAGVVELTRAGGGSTWVDLLVIVPVADGSMRVDDILFATRTTDTLRTRLEAIRRAAP